MRNPRSRAWVLLLALGVAPGVVAEEPKGTPPPDEARRWITALDHPDLAAREEAVELLGTTAGDAHVSELRALLGQRVAAEASSAADAVGAVLALHGERAGFARLIGRLDPSRPEVRRWLERARRGAFFFEDLELFPAGFDPTPKPSARPQPEPPEDTRKRWSKWLASTSDDDLRDLRSPPDLRFEDEPREPESIDRPWTDYLQAIYVLQDEGNRRSAARLFRSVALRHAASPHAASAKELADVLDAMVVEDDAWRPPATPSTLEGPERVAWLIHELRDAVGHQMMQPGRAGVLGARRATDGGSFEPAGELVRMGDAAIPALVGLLGDRRTTRCVGYWRDFHPSRTVLRYQDAAVAILGEILPFRPWTPYATAAYFSQESPETRAAVRAKVERWLLESAGKDAVERRFVGARYARLPQALEILHGLALGGQKERVLRELARLYDEPRRRAWRPEICESMCALGDRSKLDEVLRAAPTSQPLPTMDDLAHPDPEDGARFLNAWETIQRLRAEYGQPLDAPAR